jgi:hypothetical protein
LGVALFVATYLAAVANLLKYPQYTFGLKMVMIAAFVGYVVSYAVAVATARRHPDRDTVVMYAVRTVSAVLMFLGATAGIIALP